MSKEMTSIYALIELLEENKDALLHLIDFIGSDDAPAITASKGVVGYLAQSSSYEDQAAEALRTLMSKEIPPAGTPVDQKLYNEACRKVMDLERRLAGRDKWNTALEKTVLELSEQRDELQDKIDECPYDRCPCR